MRPPTCRQCGTEDFYRGRRIEARDSKQQEWVYYCRHCGGLVGKNQKLFYGTMGGFPTLFTPQEAL